MQRQNYEQFLTSLIQPQMNSTLALNNHRAKPLNDPSTSQSNKAKLNPKQSQELNQKKSQKLDLNSNSHNLPQASAVNKPMKQANSSNFSIKDIIKDTNDSAIQPQPNLNNQNEQLMMFTAAAAAAAALQNNNVLQSLNCQKIYKVKLKLFHVTKHSLRRLCGR